MSVETMYHMTSYAPLETLSLKKKNKKKQEKAEKQGQGKPWTNLNRLWRETTNLYFI